MVKRPTMLPCTCFFRGHAQKEIISPLRLEGVPLEILLLESKEQACAIAIMRTWRMADPNGADEPLR